MVEKEITYEHAKALVKSHGDCRRAYESRLFSKDDMMGECKPDCPITIKIDSCNMGLVYEYAKKVVKMYKLRELENL
jgi:hypothetical protein